MKILHYKSGNKSTNSLGCLQVHRKGSKFCKNFNHTIVSGGCRTFDRYFPVEKWSNHPDAVKLASNKLSCFRKLHEIIPDNIPEFTESASVADDWSGVIVVRHKLTGHSGDGIHIIREGDEAYTIPAPLYVKYIKKQSEFRYHVIHGEVVDVQQKRKRQSINNDEVDYQVRCGNTGWVYCRDGVSVNADASRLAILSVQALGLDFGAVDIIYNKDRDKFYVLEINTTRSLEGTEIETYANRLRGHSQWALIN